MWETYLKEMNKERNRSYTQDAFENFNSNKFLPLTFSGQTKEKLESLKGWIDSLQTSQKSSCTWIGSEFLSISPAEVFQHQLSEMMGEDGIAPDVFSTQEEKGSFDKEFWKNLMKSFTSEDLSEMFDRGTSNGHPLRLQILAFPKGTYWKLHAHPNLELNMGMKVWFYDVFHYDSSCVYDLLIVSYFHCDRGLSMNMRSRSLPTQKKNSKGSFLMLTYSQQRKV